jgi:hypothetical protein
VTRDESQCQCWGPIGIGQFWERIKAAPEIGIRSDLEEKQHQKKRKKKHQEKQLQSGQTTAEPLESGQETNCGAMVGSRTI